jgi:hypothetical protein
MIKLQAKEEVNARTIIENNGFTPVTESSLLTAVVWEKDGALYRFDGWECEERRMVPKPTYISMELLDGVEPAKGTVEVEISGGVADVTEIPAGITVKIKDYDIEGYEGVDTQTDNDGNRYVLKIYGK